MVVHSYINPYATLLGGGLYNQLLVQAGYPPGQNSLQGGQAAFLYPWQAAAPPNTLAANSLRTAVQQITTPAETSVPIVPQCKLSKSGGSSRTAAADTSSIQISSTTEDVLSSNSRSDSFSSSSMYPVSPSESSSSSIHEEANVQYLKELQAEKETLESNDCVLKRAAVKLLQNEITNMETGEGGAANPGYREPVKYFDIYRERPVRLTVRALVPVREHPKFNFVGKLLGPKGNSLKRLQDETMTKMAVLGRGSMRDKQKEEDLRLSGDAKYQHLQEDLHVEITAFAPPAEAHARIAFALTEVRKYLIPDSNDEIRLEQLREMEIMSTNTDIMDNLKQTTALISGISQGVAYPPRQGGVSPLVTRLPVGSTNGYIPTSLGSGTPGYMNPYMLGGAAIHPASSESCTQHLDQLPVSSIPTLKTTSHLKAVSSMDNCKLRTLPYLI